MNKAEVIKKLQELSSNLGSRKIITQKDVRKVPRLSYYMDLYFGGMANALKAARLPSSSLALKMNITNEQLLNYLVELKKKLGRRPMTLDLKRDEEIYKSFTKSRFSPNIFKTRFGGFKNALKQLDNIEKKSTVNVSAQKIEEGDGESFQNRARFYGRAAELHVAAELLYRGFQAANIPIDEGLDIVAIKNNKTFYFQVKHKDLNNNEAINVTRSSFERSGGGNVYYIFVLLSRAGRNFLIVPYHIVNDWIRTGLAEEKGKGYLLRIKKDSSGYKIKETVLDRYLGRWEDIR